jgi:hypothetical protein
VSNACSIKYLMVVVLRESTVSAETVRRWRRELVSLPATTDSDRVDQLRALEELKAAACAAQARIAARLDHSQREEQAALGEPARRLGRGVAALVALARRESPTKGAQHLGLAKALVGELPQALAALERGDTSEWRVTILARETACLSRQDRTRVDQELAARPGGHAEMGDRDVLVESRRIAYRLDPSSFVARATRAESDRHVSLRPAPDTMSLLSALLPVRQGVAVLAALGRHADSARSAGDQRGRGQIMADTLVERVTGLASADRVPIEVQLVMTEEAMLSADPGSSSAPAHLQGYGPVPAAFARSWVRDTDADVWLRRLYTRPTADSVVSMDSRRRVFSGQLRRFIVVRDQVCRTPWCGAPIRHVDHPHRVADGGETSADNAQGLCEACNLAKEAPGWRAWSSQGRVTTQVPTGHTFVSRPPSLGPPGRPQSPMELRLRDLLLTS